MFRFVFWLKTNIMIVMFSKLPDVFLLFADLGGGVPFDR